MKDTANLAWIDLEMSGLEPQSNVILEIASIVTDSPEHLYDALVLIEKEITSSS